MIIHAVRHFVTPWNEKGLLQGSTDISLAPQHPSNQKLKDEVSEQTGKLVFDEVLVSPKQRAIETAKLLGIENFKIEQLVTEMSFGRFEGRPKKEMLEAMSGAWQNAPLETELAPELHAMADRISTFLSKYAHRGNILLISHGAFIRALRSLILTGSLADMNKIELENGQLVTLEWNESK